MSTPEPSRPASPLRRRRVRRAPNFARFIIAGCLIGLLLAIFLGTRGATGSYSGSTAVGVLGVLLGGLGALIAAAIALVLDKHAK